MRIETADYMFGSFLRDSIASDAFKQDMRSDDYYWSLLLTLARDMNVSKQAGEASHQRGKSRKLAV